MKIDSHQHFWIYSEEEFSWIDDSMDILKRDYLPSDLEKELQQFDFDASIAVQSRTSMSETYDLLSMSKNNSKIAGIVGWINLKDPGLDKTLSSFNNEKKLVGFREILQAEEPEFMLEDSFIQGVKLIGEKGYSYDILVFPKHLNAVLKLLHRLPEQRLVIDHLAKPNISAGEVELWAQSMKKISQFSHVSIKLSGMVTEASQHWKPSDFVFYMETIFKYFGEDRILFGSDWPVCLLRAEYKEVYELALNYVRDHSSTAEKKVFGENALRFYNLSR